MNDLKANREALAEKVREAMGLNTNREAGQAIETVVNCLEQTLAEKIGVDGFSIKLGKFGKFTVHHKPAKERRIPFIGKVRMTGGRRKVKFIPLGKLRRLEKAERKD